MKFKSDQIKSNQIY